MFLLSWFTGSALRMAIGAILFILIVVVVFAGVNALLAFTGGPGPCTPGGGAITIDAANATAFQTKWDGFDAVLDGGSPSSATFNESEISSRADQYIRDETDAGFENVRICIHNGFGEATGTLDVFLGIKTDVKITGTMDLTGDSPKANIQDIEIGNVPGFVTDTIEGLVEDAVEDGLNDINLKHTYTPTLTEGEAKIDGQP